MAAVTSAEEINNAIQSLEKAMSEIARQRDDNRTQQQNLLLSWRRASGALAMLKRSREKEPATKAKKAVRYKTSEEILDGRHRPNCACCWCAPAADEECIECYRRVPIGQTFCLNCGGQN